MAEAYATVQDVQTLWRALTADEQTRVEALLPLVSDALRDEALKVGKDLDDMITAGTISSSTVKLVTVDIIGRAIRQSTDGEPMTQESQSALGYSWSGTYSIPGGGIAQCIMKNDLKRLGLRRQKMTMIPLWEGESDDD